MKGHENNIRNGNKKEEIKTRQQTHFFHENDKTDFFFFAKLWYAHRHTKKLLQPIFRKLSCSVIRYLKSTQSLYYDPQEKETETHDKK